MEHNRLGVMGHYYCGMLDIYSDLTQQCAHFGGHIEIVEVDELAHLRTFGQRVGGRGMEPAGPARPLRRRRWPSGLEDREARESAGAENHASVLTQ